MMPISRAFACFRWLAPALVVLAFVAACRGGDEESPSTAAGNSATGTLENVDSAATPTSEPSTPRPGGQPTETAPTATQEVPSAATETSSADDDPLTELDDITQVLTNYSMRADGTLDLAEEEGPEAFLLDIQQSSPENYYFKVNIGEDVIEYWLVDETYYISFDEAPVESVPYDPESTQGPFTPGYYITELQDPEQYVGAERIGEDEVNGRQTTHYRYSAEDWAAATVEQGTAISNVGGTGGELWIDNELKIIIRATADLAWTDDTSGQRLEQQLSWEVYDIDETASVGAPA